MLIQFHCRNATFDPSTGRQSVCGASVTAPAKKAGHLIACPNCGQECEVPLENSEVDRKLVTEDDPKPKKRKRPAGAKSETQKSKKKPTTKNQSPENDSGELQLMAPVTRAKPDVMSIDFQADAGNKRERASSKTIAEDRSNRCESCGKRLDDKGYCSSCKKSKRTFDKDAVRLDDVKMGLAGLQLWFANIANEGVSIRLLAIIFHVLISLLTLSLFVFGWFVIGGIGGIVFIIFVAMAFLLYAAMCFKGYQFTRDPRAKLAWFQKPFWNMVLSFCRMMKWEAYDARFKNRPVISVRNQPITDEKLVRLEGFKAAQVLDLEGTLVSDECLASIFKLKNLYCVVLKKTNVTHAGVTKLQQAIPRLWIWY